MKSTFLFIVSIFTLCSCANNKMKKEEVLPVNTDIKISYLLDIKPIITNNCIKCHYENSQDAPHNWTNPVEFKEYALKKSEVDGYSVVQAHLKGKKEPQMPLGASPLSSSDLAKIDAWISQGASID